MLTRLDAGRDVAASPGEMGQSAGRAESSVRPTSCNPCANQCVGGVQLKTGRRRAGPHKSTSTIATDRPVPSSMPQ